MEHSRQCSLPSLPNTLLDLSRYFENGQLERFSCCNSPFFRRCVLDENNRCNIILACTTLINKVLEHDITELHADATSKVVPNNMGYQLLTIHCMVQNYSIPIIYVLMEKKTRNSYDRVLRFVKNNLIPNLAPKIIVTDYETSLRDSLLSAFPKSVAVGCWFHHNQAVWRKMKRLGYLNYINTNTLAFKVIKLILSLPLLPTQDITKGFILIKSFAQSHGVHLEQLINYYERYWIKNVGSHIISVHGSPRRINNNIGSFHNALKLKFSVAHPSLWLFLGHLVKLSSNFHITNQQLLNNLRPTRHYRTKFLANSHNIKNASEKYSLGLITVWQFLNICSYTNAVYELRPRNWELHINEEHEELDDSINNLAVPMVNDAVDSNNQNISDEQNRSVCMTCMVVTMDKSPPYIVQPCGHAWACEVCVRQLKENPMCPICRLRNVMFQRIFFST